MKIILDYTNWYVYNLRLVNFKLKIMKKLFEIVSYSLSDNQKEDEFILASQKVQDEVMPKTRGFINRTVLKNQDGRFCEVVEWQCMEDAKKAADNVMQDETCLAMFAFIKQESIKMEHYEVV
jgi:hypothetical protein